MHSPYLPQISFLVLNELCLKNTIYLPEPVMNELKVMNELSLFKESTSGAYLRLQHLKCGISELSVPFNIGLPFLGALS